MVRRAAARWRRGRGVEGTSAWSVRGVAAPLGVAVVVGHFGDALGVVLHAVSKAEAHWLAW